MLFDREHSGGAFARAFRKIIKHKRKKACPLRTGKSILHIIMYTALFLSALAVTLAMCAQNSGLYLEVQEKIWLFDGPNAPSKSRTIRMNEAVTGFLAGRTSSLSDASERARLHMMDVKRIFDGVMISGGVFFALFAACACAVRRHVNARDCLWGFFPMALAAIVLFGVRTMDFSGAFIRFHEIAFSNDLWLLNPEEDFLIHCLPERFFYWMIPEVLLRTVVLYALLWAVTPVMIKRIGRRDQDEVY